MSGGMDSTSVAATACRIATEMSNPPQIQAFTVVYDRIHPDQERYYSGLVAEKLGLPIHYFVGDDYQMLNPFVKTPEPTLDFFPAMRRVQKRTQATLGRVSLTGIIADNLLSPSPVKTAFREMNPFRVLLQLLRLQRQFGKKLSLGSRIINKIKNRILSDPSNSTSRYPYWFNPEFEAKLQLADRWQIGRAHV